MIHWLQFCQSIAQFSLALQDPLSFKYTRNLDKNLYTEVICGYKHTHKDMLYQSFEMQNSVHL